MKDFKKQNLDLFIDKSSAVPLHVQVANKLRDLIKDGSLEKSDFPITEKYLEQKLNISRNTIRQAITKLADEGLLIKRRSKGIDVVEDAIRFISETVSGFSFTEGALKIGKIPSVKMLVSEIIKVPKKVIKFIPNISLEEEVFHTRRLRFLDGIPVCIVEHYIPAKYAPGITEEDFSETGPNQSVHYVLEKYYNLTISKWIETITAIIINKQDSKLLKIPENSAGLFREDVTYSNEGKIIYHSNHILTLNYRITGLIYSKERL